METVISFLKLIPAKWIFNKIKNNAQPIRNLGFTFKLKRENGKYIGNFHIYNFSKDKIRILGVVGSRKIGVENLTSNSKIDAHKIWIRLPSYLKNDNFVEVEFIINEDEDSERDAILEFQVFNEGYITLLINLEKKDEGYYKYMIQSGPKLPRHLKVFEKRFFRWLKWNWKEKKIEVVENKVQMQSKQFKK